MRFYCFQSFLTLLFFFSISLNLTNAQNPSFGFNSSSSQVDNSIIKHSEEFNGILKWEPPYDLQKNLPYFLSGFDDDGCSIWIVEFGKWDIRAQLATFGFDGIQKYIRQMLVNGYTSAERGIFKELAGNNQNETGEKPGACESLEYSVIVDMDGFSNRQLAHPPTVATCLNLARNLFSLEAKGQRLRGLFGINFNYLADTLYSFAAPLLGSLTNTITIAGTNPDRWKPKLLKAFPKSALPDWMGGSQDFKPLRVYG